MQKKYLFAVFAVLALVFKGIIKVQGRLRLRAPLAGSFFTRESSTLRVEDDKTFSAVPMGCGQLDTDGVLTMAPRFVFTIGANVWMFGVAEDDNTGCPCLLSCAASNVRKDCRSKGVNVGSCFGSSPVRETNTDKTVRRTPFKGADLQTRKPT